MFSFFNKMQIAFFFPVKEVFLWVQLFKFHHALYFLGINVWDFFYKIYDKQKACFT